MLLRDLDSEYCTWYNNSDGHLDWFSGTGRSFDAEELARSFEEGQRTKKWFNYIIEDSTTSRIGNVRIGPIDLLNRTSDLVTLIGNRAFLRKGIAAIAIRQANQIAFEQHGIRRLQTGMLATNTPSIKAYTRAGWFIEATFRGFYWRDEQPVDRICVACLNPVFFPDVGRGSESTDRTEDLK
jgi:RimJ/RimL family protein N-acetyltransferase